MTKNPHVKPPHAKPPQSHVVNRGNQRPVRRRSGSRPEDEVLIIGASSSAFRDLYHRFLWVPWPFAIAMLIVSYLAINAAFAACYTLIGGIQGARPGAFIDAFYFSIQTMGTIGYGAMYPTTHLANAFVTAESIVGLLITAVATGLVFAKFSRSTGRAVFTREAVITLMDGLPTLMFRVGNERDNLILEAIVRVTLVRTEHTLEGMTFYRMYDLPLVRERSPAVSRSFTAMHRINEQSPLFAKTPELLAKGEVELIVTLVGTDDTSLQQIHARHRYTDKEILWGMRHADILSECPDGRVVLDLRQFHLLTATRPTPAFPYPQKPVSLDEGYLDPEKAAPRAGE